MAVMDEVVGRVVNPPTGAVRAPQFYLDPEPRSEPPQILVVGTEVQIWYKGDQEAAYYSATVMGIHTTATGTTVKIYYTDGSGFEWMEFEELRRRTKVFRVLPQLPATRLRSPRKMANVRVFGGGF